MSRQTARMVLDQINLRPALVAPRMTGNMVADLRELAQADSMEAIKHFSRQSRVYVAAAYGADPEGNKPFLFADGKAIIPIHGMLVNRFPYSFGSVTGYSFIRNQVGAAMADPEVDGIIYDVNSYGGLVAGCEETSDFMKGASAAGGGKPSLAVVDSNAYSAAYMLASAADKIAATPTGGAGSIGVVLMHADHSKMLEEFGIKVTFIHAGEHKVDGNPYEPLSEEVTSDLQAEVNKIYDKFVGTVSRNRPGLSEKAVKQTEARTYNADDAATVGLIDVVQTAPAAIQAFFNAGNGSNGQLQSGKDTPMSDESAKPDVAAATPGPTAEQIAADARTAERARIRAITGHEEAKGREGLADHLVEKGMIAEDAIAILKAAPKATATPPATTGQEANHFRNAMNASGGPNVGTNADTDADGTGRPSRAAQILEAQRKATGYKPKAA
jgi:signal peptide peptidase SppA